MTRITLDLDHDLAAWVAEEAAADGATSVEDWLLIQVQRARADALRPAFPDWPEEALVALADAAEASGESPLSPDEVWAQADERRRGAAA